VTARPPIGHLRAAARRVPCPSPTLHAHGTAEGRRGGPGSSLPPMPASPRDVTLGPGTGSRLGCSPGWGAFRGHPGSRCARRTSPPPTALPGHGRCRLRRRPTGSGPERPTHRRSPTPTCSGSTVPRPWSSSGRIARAIGPPSGNAELPGHPRALCRMPWEARPTRQHAFIGPGAFAAAATPPSDGPSRGRPRPVGAYEDAGLRSERRRGLPLERPRRSRRCRPLGEVCLRGRHHGEVERLLACTPGLGAAAGLRSGAGARPNSGWKSGGRSRAASPKVAATDTGGATAAGRVSFDQP
jgi:hypothetical protein